MSFVCLVIKYTSIIQRVQIPKLAKPISRKGVSGARKALRKLKTQIKSIARKTIRASFDERIARLKRLTAG